ncbi:acid protease [Clavulina sp. PMI_390]|nr:acid protease [Clavulina sp. PMI_390]
MVRLFALTGLIIFALLPYIASAPSHLTKRVTLPIQKRNSGNFTAKDVVNRDLARLAHYKSRSFTKRLHIGTITNADVDYFAKIRICAKSYNLIIDTGSSNTWSEEVLGVYFRSESGSDTDDANGELSLGGADASKYTGELHYLPKTHTSPFSQYWGLSSISLKYGNVPLSLGNIDSAIVDTGTTLILIPMTAFDAFLLAAGGTTDSASGLAKFSKRPTGNFIISVKGDAFPLTPDQYLVPAAQYNNLGLATGSYYAWIASGGMENIVDVSFIIGQKFLENYYSVYDTTNEQIGFATRA